MKNQKVGIARPTPSTTPVYALNFEQTVAEKIRDEDAERPAGVGIAAAGDPNEFGLKPVVTERATMDDLDLRHLGPKEQRRVRQALRPFSSMWGGKLGTVRVTEHRIELKPGAKPVFAQPYRAGPKAGKIEQDEVDKMLKAGVIEPARSEFASPVVLVPKPDGSLLFCVDYRRLNAATIKDSYPLPRMDECLDSLGDAQFFTTLVCNSGYWQIPVATGDKPKTAFTCHAGCFQFCRMPFGLCNSSATFQRTVDFLLSRFRWRSCLVYLDDIIIFSNSFDEHLAHVTETLDALQAAGFSLKLSKCHFFTRAVDYLGHTIRPGLLEVATKNTAAIEGFREPRNQTPVRSFLGLCNVYRRFVPNFERVTAPLNAMLQNAYDFELPAFTEDQRRAFELLKRALIKPPVLQLPRSGTKLSVDTDACDYQVGCALMQEGEDGIRHPIGYWSRGLTPAEKNYSAGEKECLAVIWAVQILRPYLESTHFDLYTDHQALCWVMSMANASGRLARWRLRLLEHDFTIHYRKGLKNQVADAVSRLPTLGETATTPDLDIPCFVVEGAISTYVEGASGNRLRREEFDFEAYDEWSPGRR